jgi:ADP-heptose:LPS heptosyltransferase
MKILVYQIGQLGDTIVSIPALRAVRRHFGETALLYMLHDVTHLLVTAEMVLEGSGLVDEFIPYSPEKALAKTPITAARLWRRLRREHFDAAVSLLPSDRPRWSLWRDRMFFRGCGISRFLGFRALPTSEIRPRDPSGRPAQTQNEAVLRLRRISFDGIDIASQGFLASPLLSVSRDRQAKVDAWLERRRRYPMRPLVALGPGCKKPGNAWPPERFVAIARRLLSLDRFELVILGGPAERDLVDRLVDILAGRAIYAAGRFSVMESAALLAHCSLLIGLDTGTTHLAAAMGVPCVVIQSANSFPGQWDPLGENHSVIRADVPCAGCLRQECRIAGHPCMSDIGVDRVWTAIEKAIPTAEHEYYARDSYV